MVPYVAIKIYTKLYINCIWPRSVEAINHRYQHQKMEGLKR